LPPALPAGVLDIGCGSGWWLERLAEHGFSEHELSGIDASPSRVGAARLRVPEADVRVGDARSLPYETASIGLVLLMLVLSSLPDATSVENTLREARRVTAPEGVIVIWEPRVPNPFNAQTRLIRLRTLQRELGSELTVRTITVFPQLARRLGRRTEALYPLLARVPPLRTHRLVLHGSRAPAA
jgi:ubiquinone/menaquinone biosynthesis C-methylase UbiE